ncbi:conserved Plasmodium protein, unknown function [Plasmodium ovale curtisi]|uniref:PHD-type domain-containing protein n=1 Tax=Plasmodium ovale curtisi TaxID=864141 RepID=A0A1A8W4B6_PLAOA|nr:conserved Plasmodium protein, unknown function [Plasmodium ovale curtisi]
MDDGSEDGVEVDELQRDVNVEDVPVGEAATGEATTGEATTGEAITGEAITGEAATGEATTGDTLRTEEDGKKLFLELEEKNKRKSTSVDIFDIDKINRISRARCNNIISISSFKNIYNENLLDEDSLLKLLTYDFLSVQKDIQEFNSNILSDKYKRLKNFENILLLYPHFNDFQLRKLSELILEKYHSSILNIQGDDCFFSFFNKFLSLLNNKNLMLCSVCLSKATYADKGREEKRLSSRGISVPLENTFAGNGTGLGSSGSGQNMTSSMCTKLRGLPQSANFREKLENKKERRLGSLSVLKKCSVCNVFICYFCCHRMNIDIVKNYLNDEVKLKATSNVHMKKNERVRSSALRTNRVGRPSKNKQKSQTKCTAQDSSPLKERIATNVDDSHEQYAEGSRHGKGEMVNRRNSMDKVNPVSGEIEKKGEKNSPLVESSRGKGSMHTSSGNKEYGENDEQGDTKEEAEKRNAKDGTNANMPDSIELGTRTRTPRLSEKDDDPNSDIEHAERMGVNRKDIDVRNILSDHMNKHDNENDFVCPRCAYFKVKKKIGFCSYCPRLDGFLNCFEDKVKKELSFVHPKCLEYVNTAYSKKNNMNESKTGFFKKICSYCRIKHGIVITCSNTDCDISFHISCGILLGCKMDNFFGRVDIYNPKKAYCFKHTFQHCKKNSLLNFINTNKLFFFENFLYFPFNHLYNFLLGTYIFNYLNRKCTNHLMKPIRIEDYPSLSAIFEKTQMNITKRNPNMPSNDFRRSHKKKTGANETEDGNSYVDNNAYMNDTTTSKDIKFLNEENVRTPSNTLSNVQDDVKNEFSISSFSNKVNENISLPDKKNNPINQESELYKSSLAASPNSRCKSDVVFVDDNVTESAVSVLSENETEELRSFQNVSFFNSRSYAHINNIVNNSFMQYMRKTPYPPNAPPFYIQPNGVSANVNINGVNISSVGGDNNSVMKTNNTFNFVNGKFEDMKDKTNALSRNDKYSQLEKKRKKYILQANANNDGNSDIGNGSFKKNDVRDVAEQTKGLGHGNVVDVNGDGKKRRKCRKNKGSSSNYNMGNAADNSDIHMNIFTSPSEHNVQPLHNNIKGSNQAHFDIMNFKNMNTFNELGKRDINHMNKSGNYKKENMKLSENVTKEEKSNVKNDEQEQSKEEQIYCPVCKCFYEELSDGSPADGLNWIGCDKCERWYHWICCKYSIDNPPDMENDWYCSSCLNSK